MPSLLGERGAGDAFAAAAPPLRHEIADEVAPSSPRRGWLSLTLNGMADTQPSGRCHVCFRPGVDVVIPPPAASIDTPSCAQLLAGRFPDAQGVRARRNLTFFWAGRVVPRGH